MAFFYNTQHQPCIIYIQSSVDSSLVALLDLLRLLVWLVSKCFFIHLGGRRAYLSLCFARLDADDWVGMASLGGFLYLFLGIIPRGVVAFHLIPSISSVLSHHPNHSRLTDPEVTSRSIHVVSFEPLSMLHHHLLPVLLLTSVR